MAFIFLFVLFFIMEWQKYDLILTADIPVTIPKRGKRIRLLQMKVQFSSLPQVMNRGELIRKVVESEEFNKLLSSHGININTKLVVTWKIDYLFRLSENGHPMLIPDIDFNMDDTFSINTTKDYTSSSDDDDDDD